MKSTIPASVAHPLVPPPHPSSRLIREALTQRGNQHQVQALPSGPGLQEIIVGSAVLVAAGAAIAFGTRGEPVVCDECNGTGGIKCFVCEGTGKPPKVPRDAMYDSPGGTSKPMEPRAFLSKDNNPRQCRACGGVGLILCKKCSGTGYMKRM